MIDVAARIDKGCRETNEDRVIIGGCIRSEGTYSCLSKLPLIVAVCDGCGGYNGGDIAAEIVLTCLLKQDTVKMTDPLYLESVFKECNNCVIEKKRAHSQYKDMCTTIAGCVFYDNSLIIFHAGDSRVYRFDKWGLTKMTIDHSLVQLMIELGQITPEQALDHPQRNLINRCIGLNCDPPEIRILHTAMDGGEIFLLCSDGLWENVSDYEIEKILSKGMSLSEMADKLVDMALENGANDNISVGLFSAQDKTKTDFKDS